LDFGSAPWPIVSSGSQWLHEIKHDGFRVIARKEGPRVRLYSRPGNDLTHRFPLIVDALARLRSRSCIIELIATIAINTDLRNDISWGLRSSLTTNRPFRDGHHIGRSDDPA